MNIFNYIGIVAGIFGLSIQLPQIYKIIKTRSATDLSYFSMLIALTNQVLWVVYAIYINNIIYIINATGQFIIMTTQLFLKIHYDKINSQNDPNI
tara:strand:+ start:416 stop:700 length:285 start_codon:yes stop_codon:yes gene_type:complete